jgi:tyrosyl-tRNA synthetase
MTRLSRARFYFKLAVKEDGKMNIEEQVQWLLQGTEYGDDGLAKTMAVELGHRLEEARRAGRPLRVYCGYDPRTTDLHLGHTVTMRKLRQFQELGHEVTFLIGSYTSQIGDPSDKDQLRPQLTQAQAEENGRTYAEQAYRILDRAHTRIRYNHEWLAGVSFAQLIQLASHFTLQQFLTRENFRLRWEKGDPIYLHETFYSIMQGYDAFMLQADVQVGGTDQLFNIVTAARKIMPALGARPNIAVILSILPGTDGVIKMSKSLGNHIPLQASPEDMFGKLMSVPDAAMPAFHRLVTRWTPAEIAALEGLLQAGSLHPRDAKLQLAREVVSSLYGDAEARRAEAAFLQLFQRRQQPDQIEPAVILPGQTVVEILLALGWVRSRNEGRRLLEQKGVRLDGQVLEADRTVDREGVLQAGRRRFARLVFRAAEAS